MKTFRPALVLLALFTLVTGVAYPALVTATAQLAMPYRANGSLVVGSDGDVIGSELIGQSFDDPRYFWGRPSSTPTPYDGATSSGSNLGPLSDTLAARVETRAATLHAADPTNEAPIPVDLVTASASGLDPHVSPAAARYQIGRVARARGLDESRVGALVDAHVEPRTLGLIGEPRVNVLRLNLALDQLDHER